MNCTAAKIVPTLIGHSIIACSVLEIKLRLLLLKGEEWFRELDTTFSSKEDGLPPSRYTAFKRATSA